MCRSLTPAARGLGAAPKDFEPPKPFLPRVRGDHKADWLNAIRSSTRAACDFNGHGGLLAEIVLLGNVPIRAGKRVEWDGANLKIPNAPDAEQYLTREYRRGWEL